MPTHLPRSRNGKAAEDVARICLWEAGREVMSLYRADKQVEFKGTRQCPDRGRLGVGAGDSGDLGGGVS